MLQLLKTKKRLVFQIVVVEMCLLSFSSAITTLHPPPPQSNQPRGNTLIQYIFLHYIVCNLGWRLFIMKSHCLKNNFVSFSLRPNICIKMLFLRALMSVWGTGQATRKQPASLCWYQPSWVTHQVRTLQSFSHTHHEDLYLDNCFKSLQH